MLLIISKFKNINKFIGIANVGMNNVINDHFIKNIKEFHNANTGMSKFNLSFSYE